MPSARWQRCGYMAAAAAVCAWLAAQPHAAAQPVQPDDARSRAVEVEPTPAEPKSGRTKLAAEPVADGAVIAVVTSFAGVLDLINSTGEVRPQQISPRF